MQNPLESYRRTQRELRQQFDAFTRQNCPNCPTPCCRKPARILPTDILLAESTGWKANLPTSHPDEVSHAAGEIISALHQPPESAEGLPQDEPCDYLTPTGCSFPTDLRPFGCTTYICRYMHEKLDRQTLSRIKRMVRELEHKHHYLLNNIRDKIKERD